MSSAAATPRRVAHAVAHATPRTVVLRVRVLVTENAGHWFARGLDVDFAAQGKSWLEVQKAFETGFVATLKEHIKAYGTLEYFLRPSPPHVFDMWRKATQRQSNEALLPLKLVKDYDLAEIEYFEVAT